MGAITLNPLVPADTEAEKLGASRIRNLTSAFLVFFGQSGAASFTWNVSPFTIDLNGNITLAASLTLAGNPSAALQAASKEYVDASASGAYIGAATGPNTYVATLTPTPASQAVLEGKLLVITFAGANSGAATLNANSFGAIPVLLNGAPVGAGTIPANSTLLLYYDGANYNIVATQNNASVVTPYAVRTLDGFSTGATQIYTVTANLVSLYNGTQTNQIVNALDAQVNLGTAGPAVGGRDQAGAFSNGSTVHVYAIMGPAQIPGLIASMTAPSGGGPTLPANYTAWAYLFTAIMNGANFPVSYLRGNKFYYDTPVQVLTKGVATGATAISLTSAVPGAPVLSALLQIEAYAQSVGLDTTSTTASFTIVSGGGGPVLLAGVTGGSANNNSNANDMMWEVPNASQEIFYSVATFQGTNADNYANAWVLGYEVPNNA